MERPTAGGLGQALIMTTMWIVLTAIVILVYRTVPRSPAALALRDWIALYAMTLVLPLGWAVRLRRRLGVLVARYPDTPEPVIRELVQASWAYLILGYVAAVTAIVLLLSYVPR